MIALSFYIVFFRLSSLKEEARGPGTGEIFRHTVIRVAAVLQPVDGSYDAAGL